MAAIPDHVEVIILGTGLTNSILAAACSRIGKSVLHLDKNSYYGNDWASFTFKQMVKWIETERPGDKSLENIPEELLNKSRLFCIDLSPRFLYSNGDMVDLLVKSNVARYHEFKNNIRILCAIEDEIHTMPCRRNDVFTSPLLNNLDKRRLMKFLELCLKYGAEDEDSEEFKSFCEQPIKEYLESRRMDTTLQEYIINSIAMMKPTDSTREACKRIRKFMLATERYGRSPFLFPLYGCGEFPQSFCRLSAVFGGLYCLNTQIKEVKVLQATLEGEEQTKSETENFEVRFSNENYTVKCDMLIVEQADLKSLHLEDGSKFDCEYLSRAILITKSSIVPPAPESDSNSPGQDFVSFLRIPPNGKKNVNLIYLMELNSSNLVCPKKFQIVYLWTRSTTDNPETDLKDTVERLFKQKKSVVWKFYYRQLALPTSGFASHTKDHSQSKLFVTSPFCDDIDYSHIIGDAERIFKCMCPGQDFLPRAPDPDEIISS